MSDFAGLQVALSALYAQRQGLETAGHNIANANTDGYSRQRVRLAAADATPALYSRSGHRGGEGVTVAGVDRVRDLFLEARGLQEHAGDTQLQRTKQVLGQVEDLLSEPGDNGIQAELGEFWAGWDDVANRPDDGAARAQLLQRGQALASHVNQAAEALQKLAGDAADQFGRTVEEVNATAGRVAELNRAIQTATAAGLSPNDLADQRDALVVKLAEDAGVTTRAGDTGAVDVYLGGTALVRGDRAEPLAVTATGGTVGLQWQRLGLQASAPGGELASLADAANQRVPGYLAGLDGVAHGLEVAVNALHTQALDKQGTAGQAFFTHDASQAGTPGGIARTLAVTPAVAADPDLVAARDPAKGPLDGSVALEIAELANGASGTTASQLAAAGLDPRGPDAAYRAFVVQLGADADTANRRVAIQTDITKQVDAARQAQSGVNLDEDMTDMLAFQHAYEAAAKYLSTVDATLETLVNLVH